MTALVIAEHDHQIIKPATLHTITAALACGGEVHLLVAGHQAASAANSAAKITGVTRVIHIDAPHLEHHLAENLADQILALAKSYSHILAPATASGKNVLPRVAALLDVAQISIITKVISSDTFERPIYAGNAIATVQATDAIKVLTVQTTAFEAADPSGGAAQIDIINPSSDGGHSKLVHRDLSVSARPELSSAKVVVSGGRALGSAEQYQAIMEPLADKLGAALGASRAAVDAGFVPNDYQVGQTGQIVAPDLYIAVGISGAIQHIAGMKDSRIIVAINKDPDAPIFAVADYGLVADLFTAVPELVAELS